MSFEDMLHKHSEKIHKLDHCFDRYKWFFEDLEVSQLDMVYKPH